MTIDEAIAHAREVAIEQSSIATELSLAVADASKCIKCKQEHEQLAEWLEELKVYQQHEIICNNGYNAGYNKAIDDFVQKVKEHQYVLSDVINSKDYGMFTVGIEQIAEQLKAGGENERSI